VRDIDAFARELAGPDDGEDLATSAKAQLRARLARSGKVCRACRCHKPLSAYEARSRTADGLNEQCRVCQTPD
jgi:hypothetical protein